MEDLYNRNVELEAELEDLKRKCSVEFDASASFTDKDCLGESIGELSVHNICVDPTSQSFLEQVERDQIAR